MPQTVKTASYAKTVGLIDEVGTMDRAIALAQSLAEVRKFLTNQL